jgi:hypothetical protein
MALSPAKEDKATLVFVDLENDDKDMLTVGDEDARTEREIISPYDLLDDSFPRSS